MIEVIAQAKFVRVSPKKAREVLFLIKNLSLDEAMKQLTFLKKASAKPILAVLKSAVANATNNFKLKEDQLKIAHIEVTAGPVFKRWRAVSRGSAHAYKRRTAQIKVRLSTNEVLAAQPQKVAGKK
jgi:large subunit ribosomal protein L22